jgi:predicted transglutaminase-like cysteine proteinase
MPVIVLDQAHWAQLEQVQLKVDGKVTFASDESRLGKADYWEIADKSGDCEDIALAKRARLMQMGWAADDLRIAVVIDERGAVHAVLTVDVMSTKGKPATYVLDNRFLHVETWKHLSDYGYTFVERSKPGSTQWTRLEAGGEVAARLIAAATIPAPIQTAAPAPYVVTIKAVFSDDEIAAPTATAKALDDSLVASLDLTAPETVDAVEASVELAAADVMPAPIEIAAAAESAEALNDTLVASLEFVLPDAAQDSAGDLMAALPAGVEGQGHGGEGLAEGIAGAVGGVADLDAPVDVANGSLHAALAPADTHLAIADKGA